MPIFHNLPDWLAHLETAHPVGIDMGLTRITRVKEALGLRIDETDDGATIHPGALGGGTIESHGDHRIAMAFSIAVEALNIRLRSKSHKPVDLREAYAATDKDTPAH